MCSLGLVGAKVLTPPLQAMAQLSEL